MRLSVRSTVESLTTGLFGIWLIATVLSQHPDSSLDRVRRLDDRWGNTIIPNWRFFAPNPAVEDVHILYRFANQDKTEHSLWYECHTISDRRWFQAFWFPRRRFEKAVFDAHQTILMGIAHASKRERFNSDDLKLRTVNATEKMLNNYVRRVSNPDSKWVWQQLILVRFAGHDPEAAPIYDMVLDYQLIYEGELN